MAESIGPPSDRPIVRSGGGVAAVRLVGHRRATPLIAATISRFEGGEEKDDEREGKYKMSGGRTADAFDRRCGAGRGRAATADLGEKNKEKSLPACIDPPWKKRRLCRFKSSLPLVGVLEHTESSMLHDSWSHPH